MNRMRTIGSRKISDTSDSDAYAGYTPTKVRNVPQEFDELRSARIRSRRSERRAGRNRRSILG